MVLRLRYSTFVFKFRLRFGPKVTSYCYHLRRSHFLSAQALSGQAHKFFTSTLLQP